MVWQPKNVRFSVIFPPQCYTSNIDQQKSTNMNDRTSRRVAEALESDLILIIYTCQALARFLRPSYPPPHPMEAKKGKVILP
jgi:hypothetical protein